MRKPTKINAGAVAKDGIAVKIGAKIMASRNRNPVTTEDKPVRPPAATPAEDSTQAVVVEVPNMAPAEVAMASVSRTGRMRGSLPF